VARRHRPREGRRRHHRRRNARRRRRQRAGRPRRRSRNGWRRRRVSPRRRCRRGQRRRRSQMRRRGRNAPPRGRAWNAGSRRRWRNGEIRRWRRLLGPEAQARRHGLCVWRWRQEARRAAIFRGLNGREKWIVGVRQRSVRRLIEVRLNVQRLRRSGA
jgi:hypothetical protein